MQKEVKIVFIISLFVIFLLIASFFSFGFFFQQGRPSQEVTSKIPGPTPSPGLPKEVSFEVDVEDVSSDDLSDRESFWNSFFEKYFSRYLSSRSDTSSKSDDLDVNVPSSPKIDLTEISDEDIEHCTDSCPEFHGMAVESVFWDTDLQTFTIETTGALYVLRDSGMELWRKIDPLTNTENPLLVATLTFDISDLSFDTVTSDSVIVSSSEATFTFNPDSLFFIRASEDFTYTHTNLIASALWNKDYYGDYRNRMWSDGNGGSLLASIDDDSSVSSYGVDFSEISLPSGSSMAHMVYPPKTFDFEALYGESSKPLVQSIFYLETQSGSRRNIRDHIDNIDYYIDNDVGVFMIGGIYYPEKSVPEQLDSGVMGYRFLPEYESDIRELISLAHENDLKVISYISYPSNPVRWSYLSGPQKGEHQDIAVTLQWMRDFQEEYDLDGWFFDNGDAGDFMTDYDFVRQVRRDIGPEGIILHHNSIDVWGYWSGLKAVMYDAYVDYTLRGETGRGHGHIFDLPTDQGFTAEIHDFNDPFLRYYIASYGFSQSFAMHKLITTKRHSISQPEKLRFISQNLHGVERVDSGSYRSYFLPIYASQKQAYLSGDLQISPDWPLDDSQSWFLTPQNISFQQSSPDAALELSGTEFISSSDLSQELSRDALTYSTWVYWKNSTSSLDLILGQGLPYLGIHDDGRLRFTARVGDELVNVVSPDSHAIERERWYHVVGTHDGSSQKLYVNGLLVKQKGYEGLLEEFSESSFTIGNWKSDSSFPSFTGSLDDIKVYSRALSASEVLQEFEGGTITEGLVFESDFETPLDPSWALHGTPSIVSTSEGLLLTWQTPSPADSSVSYSPDGVWWPLPNEYESDALVTDHSVLLPGISEDTLIRIRSRNGLSGADEKIWGTMGSRRSLNPLLLHWTFDGTNLPEDFLSDDVSSVGSLKYVPGIKNQALLFGENERIIHESSNLFSSDEITYSAWVHWNGEESGLEVFMGQHLPYFGIHDDGRARFSTRINGVQVNTLSKVGSIQPHTWYYLVGTFDGKIQKLYVDGELVKEKSSPGMLEYGDGSSSDILVIGDWHKDSKFPFSGSLDEIKIYNRALSAQEILDAYNTYLR